jgi:hypothetical protein
VSAIADFSRPAASSGTRNAEAPTGSPSRTVFATMMIAWAFATIVTEVFSPEITYPPGVAVAVVRMSR